MNSKEIKLTWDTAKKITGLIYHKELDIEDMEELIETQLRIFKMKYDKLDIKLQSLKAHLTAFKREKVY